MGLRRNDTFYATSEGKYGDDKVTQNLPSVHRSNQQFQMPQNSVQHQAYGFKRKPLYDIMKMRNRMFICDKNNNNSHASSSNTGGGGNINRNDLTYWESNKVNHVYGTGLPKIPVSTKYTNGIMLDNIFNSGLDNNPGYLHQQAKNVTIYKGRSTLKKRPTNFWNTRERSQAPGTNTMSHWAAGSGQNHPMSKASQLSQHHQQSSHQHHQPLFTNIHLKHLGKDEPLKNIPIYASEGTEMLSMFKQNTALFKNSFIKSNKNDNSYGEVPELADTFRSDGKVNGYEPKRTAAHLSHQHQQVKPHGNVRMQQGQATQAVQLLEQGNTQNTPVSPEEPTVVVEAAPAPRQHQPPPAAFSSSQMPPLHTKAATTTTLPTVAKSMMPSAKYPLSSKDALKLYGSKLNLFEQTEILTYPEIYYLGLDARKVDAVPGLSSNNGFDDENGCYIRVTNDHLAYRYEVLESLGKGSFGQVVRAIDHKTKKSVAIKIIRNKKRFHQQATIEVKILEELKRLDIHRHYNIVHIKEFFCFRNHLCIIFELLGSNLYDVLKKNDFNGFTLTHIRKLTVQVVNCLVLLAQEKIIHCDLKPKSVEIRNKYLESFQWKQSTRQQTPFEFIKPLYTYIQSRFYRSPEVILGLTYGLPIDIWSLGCILPELYTGYPIFPGENENEQLACIMEILGLPPKSMLERASRKRVFFDSKGNPANLTNSRGKKRFPNTKSFEDAIKVNDTKFVDFIKKCLIWEPGDRLTPAEALEHPWLKREHIRQQQIHQKIAMQNLVKKQKPNQKCQVKVEKPAAKAQQAQEEQEPQEEVKKEEIFNSPRSNKEKRSPRALPARSKTRRRHHKTDGTTKDSGDSDSEENSD